MFRLWLLFRRLPLSSVQTYKSRSAQNGGKSGTWLDAAKYGEFCDKLRKVISPVRCKFRKRWSAGGDRSRYPADPGLCLESFSGFLDLRAETLCEIGAVIKADAPSATKEVRQRFARYQLSEDTGCLSRCEESDG